MYTKKPILIQLQYQAEAFACDAEDFEKNPTLEGLTPCYESLQKLKKTLHEVEHQLKVQKTILEDWQKMHNRKD